MPTTRAGQALSTKSGESKQSKRRADVSVSLEEGEEADAAREGRLRSQAKRARSSRITSGARYQELTAHHQTSPRDIAVERTPLKWKCKSCRAWHSELPLAYGRALPDPCQELKDRGKEHLVESAEDFCTQEDEDGNKSYFVRGRITLPVIDTDHTFCWNVWVSLSEKNFQRSVQDVHIVGRESRTEPFFGWLCTDLGGEEGCPYKHSSEHLKTNVHTQPVGCVPEIELEPTDHPLAVEQREGISLKRIKELAALLLHQ